MQRGATHGLDTDPPTRLPRRDSLLPSLQACAALITHTALLSVGVHALRLMEGDMQPKALAMCRAYSIRAGEQVPLMHSNLADIYAPEAQTMCLYISKLFLSSA